MELKQIYQLAEWGLYIFPLKKRGKEPQAGLKWRDVSTVNRQKIEGWHKKYPDCNWGVDCGKSDILVIDIDPRDGGNMASLCLPESDFDTPISKTGGGGWHIFYRQPEGKLGNKSGNLPDGIDIRGVGGYVVSAGSVHSNKNSPYFWTQDFEQYPIKPLPERIIKKVNEKKITVQITTPKITSPRTFEKKTTYGQAALQSEIKILRNTFTGNRNNQLNSSAFSLGTLVSSGVINEVDVFQSLLEAGISIGLSENEARKTINSGLSSGKENPRQIPINSNGRSKKITETSTKKINKTDLGNAHILVKLHGKDIRFSPSFGWRKWNGKIWETVAKQKIVNLAKSIPQYYYDISRDMDDDTRKEYVKWGLQSESKTKLLNAVDLAETDMSIFCNDQIFDLNPMKITMKNKTINLDTYEIYEPERTDMITKMGGTKYDSRAECPLWLLFLDRIFNRNNNLISFLQRAVGYSLTGSVNEQCLFFLYGTGRNGKSVFSEIIKSLLGNYAQKAPADMLMINYKGGNGIPNDIARLRGARLALCSEIEEGQRLAEAKVKDLTGGDTIAARLLHKEWFDFKPTHKLWIYGNHKPKIRGTDEGIWRRIFMIPFDVTIPIAEQDKNLTDKLRKELPGILNWAIEGCKLWQKNGLKPPSIVREATDDFRDESNVLSDFIDDKCIVNVNSRVAVTQIYQEYKEWCSANSERPISKKKMGVYLEAKGFFKQKKYTIDWIGIGLMAENGEMTD